MRKTLAALALCGMGLFSCAHLDSMRGAELSSITDHDSGVILIVHLFSLDSKMMSGGCKLDLGRSGDKADHPLTLQVGSQAIFASLPEGEYRIRDIECLDKRWDLTDKGWPEFSSIAGKISILPPLTIRYATQLNHLTMTSSMKHRESAQTEILAMMERLPKAARSRVVSGYEKNAVTIDMIREIKVSGRYRLTDPLSRKVLAIDSRKKAGAPSFSACYRDESRVNELWLGNVEIEARFEAGQFEKLDIKSSPNTFSTQFLECAKSRIRDYKPGLEANLKYSFFL